MKLLFLIKLITKQENIKNLQLNNSSYNALKVNNDKGGVEDKIYTLYNRYTLFRIVKNYSLR